MWRIACLIVLCVSGPGCRLWERACRTLIVEPRQYHEDHDRHEFRARCRRLAEYAWSEKYWSCPEAHFSQDYVDGFLHGFAEYVLAGGSALPPPLPLPPRKYWRDEYATPGGQQAASDWLAGAYDGIKSAQESGYREWMTVPASPSTFTAAPQPVITAPPGTPLEAAPAAPAGPIVPPPPAATREPSVVQPYDPEPPAQDATAPGSADSSRRIERSRPPFATRGHRPVTRGHRPVTQGHRTATRRHRTPPSKSLRRERSADEMPVHTHAHAELLSKSLPDEVPAPQAGGSHHTTLSASATTLVVRPGARSKAGTGSRLPSSKLLNTSQSQGARPRLETGAGHISAPAASRPIAHDAGEIRPVAHDAGESRSVADGAGQTAPARSHLSDGPTTLSVLQVGPVPADRPERPLSDGPTTLSVPPPIAEPAGGDQPDDTGPAFPQTGPAEELTEASTG